MWETLNRLQYANEKLAWGDTGLENEHEEFFTPPHSLEIGQLELEKVGLNHGIVRFLHI
jgi:hypothetical protein